LAGPAFAGQRYVGISDGAGRCPPIRFDLTVEGGAVRGEANSAGPHGPIRWRIEGSARGDTLRLETVHYNRRRAVPSIRAFWAGQFDDEAMDLEQLPTPTGCERLRRAVLKRV
jgi:hypothetical protein